MIPAEYEDLRKFLEHCQGREDTCLAAADEAKREIAALKTQDAYMKLEIKKLVHHVGLLKREIAIHEAIEAIHASSPEYSPDPPAAGELGTKSKPIKFA